LPGSAALLSGRQAATIASTGVEGRLLLPRTATAVECWRLARGLFGRHNGVREARVRLGEHSWDGKQPEGLMGSLGSTASLSRRQAHLAGEALPRAPVRRGSPDGQGRLIALCVASRWESAPPGTNRRRQATTSTSTEWLQQLLMTRNSTVQ
jgi:hypothetical protein